MPHLRTLAPSAATNQTSVSAARVVLVLSSLGFFLITLDILIVNLALPSIEAELGGGTAAQQWVIDGYTLMFAALLRDVSLTDDQLGRLTGASAEIEIRGGRYPDWLESQTNL